VLCITSLNASIPFYTEITGTGELKAQMESSEKPKEGLLIPFIQTIKNACLKLTM